MAATAKKSPRQVKELFRPQDMPRLDGVMRLGNRFYRLVGLREVAGMIEATGEWIN